MATTGTVRHWNGDEGWKVLDSPETPGGCWTLFSAVQIAGYRVLTPGQLVNLDWELADQDGFRFRAVRVWPVGTDPVEAPPSAVASPAYSSSLTITYDDPVGPSPQPPGTH